MTPPTTPPHPRTAWIAAVFAATTALAIGAADHALQHPLAGFREEYAGGGSCKLRGLDGFELLLGVGLLAWPAAGFAALRFAGSLVRAPRPRDARWLGLATSLATIALLRHFAFVGPALGLCP
ncbi:MAG: hypothetical protein U0325_06615 [Polyangiales bacterium]